MALFGFGSKKDQSTTSAPSGDPKMDAKKAKRFFAHAHTVADTGNHDYGIELFLKGLQFDPTNAKEHEALRELAMKRKMRGGKPAGMMEKLKYSGGKTPSDKMANALLLSSKDPGDVSLLASVTEAISELGDQDLTAFYGKLAIEANQTSGSPKKAVYQKLVDVFEKVRLIELAVQCCRAVLQMEPNNGPVQHKMKNLQATLTEMKGNYGGKGSFQDSIRDAEKQKEIRSDEQIAGSTENKAQLLSTLKQHVEENPDDLDGMLKYVNALLTDQVREQEEEAIRVLSAYHKRLNQYRFKMRIGDIRIKQYVRALREIDAKIKAEGKTEALLAQRQQVMAERLAFETKEFAERAENYPTDLAIKYELGVRQFQSGDYDDAIASFQEAQSDTKTRTRALYYLGRSFAAKQWHDEAIDTLRRGLEEHPNATDTIGKELNYYLMDALERKARENNDLETATEAQKIASSIAQTDINFKDIRDRVNGLRALQSELRG